jgi:hypothetical protein
VLPEIAEDRTALLEAGPAETHEQELTELVAEGGHGKEGNGRQRDLRCGRQAIGGETLAKSTAATMMRKGGRRRTTDDGSRTTAIG